jgi:hypothetical protein
MYNQVFGGNSFEIQNEFESENHFDFEEFDQEIMEVATEKPY